MKNDSRQKKYEECVALIEELHNVVLLVLSASDVPETPLQLVQMCINGMVQYENFPDELKEELNGVHDEEEIIQKLADHYNSEPDFMEPEVKTNKKSKQKKPMYN